MTKTILITGIGGDISQGVATILRENRPNFRLIGVDVHAQHGGHLFVDRFAVVPYAGAPDYMDEIKSIVNRYSVDVVIPMTEPELAVSRPFYDLAPNVKWIAAGDQAVGAGLDKLETIRALTALALPVPWTRLASEGSPKDFPCILKTRFGSGSRAVFTVNNDEDAGYLMKRYPESIFQEILEPADREVTCAVYRRRDGRVASLLMLRRLTGGFTGWAKVIRDEETSLMCEVIAAGLNLQGSMNIQLRLTDKGPRVFEINPRFSSTVLMRHRAGFSDVLWALDESEGKSISFPDIPPNLLMVRIQSASIFEDISLGAG